MEAKLENIFRCEWCGYWYLRDHMGPGRECKPCFWNVPISREKVLTIAQVVVMMARELEELLTR